MFRTVAPGLYGSRINYDLLHPYWILFHSLDNWKWSGHNPALFTPLLWGESPSTAKPLSLPQHSLLKPSDSGQGTNLNGLTLPNGATHPSAQSYFWLESQLIRAAQCPSLSITKSVMVALEKDWGFGVNTGSKRLQKAELYLMSGIKTQHPFFLSFSPSLENLLGMKTRSCLVPWQRLFISM